MNDEIQIYVVGGASNKEVANLPDVLRRAGCNGKIAFRKVSPQALKRAQEAIDGVEKLAERHRQSSWR